MSSEAWVICRSQPDMPEQGELDDGRAPYTVQATTAEATRMLSQHAPQHADLRWMVVFEFAGDWFDRFDAGGRALARRCGGGVLWSPLWEGRGVEAIIVEPRPDATVGGSWTLTEALEHAMWHETDWDEEEWREEVGDD
jgi:hypothetical protein